MNTFWLIRCTNNTGISSSNVSISKVPALLILVFSAFFSGCSESVHHKYKALHEKHHGESSEQGHGQGEHDTQSMPGLKGKNASQAESDEIAILFRNFDTITREVKSLENGIRTVTLSSDAAVMKALVSHSVGMINRVKRKDDPKIIIQSTTLDTFFLQGDEIDSSIEVTEQGLIITQTSENPQLVEALQTHAAEVTAMVDRGMEAVHEMMEKQGRGH